MASDAYCATFKKDGTRTQHLLSSGAITSNNVRYAVVNTQNGDIQAVLPDTASADAHVAALARQRPNGGEALSIVTLVIS